MNNQTTERTIGFEQLSPMMKRRQFVGSLMASILSGFSLPRLAASGEDAKIPPEGEAPLPGDALKAKMLADAAGPALTRTLKAEKRYLNIPIKNGVPARHISLRLGDRVVREMSVELAPAIPDWWVFMELTPFNGQDITLILDELPGSTQDLRSLLQADEILGHESIYHEVLRPQFHFSPKRGWMNDPNGLVFYDGEYHLFYQHYPYGSQPSLTADWKTHWGHAVSKDLIHWQELPVALYPEKGLSLWSGSVVVDEDNTAAFQKGSEKTLVALFTLADKKKMRTGEGQPFSHGMLRVSENKRYFEHADGTPFYWLGDTWWSGLSDRLHWEDFQQLAQDRKAKGFTVIQLCAGLVPFEEVAPIDPGFRNEGGSVWDPSFTRINPKYFDYADRRIQYLLNNGLVPAIFGGWRGVLAQMGVRKMKQHWRYVIARYGAYPVFWVVGGEVYDPPPAQHHEGLPFGATTRDLSAPGWTEVTRYVRATDPYHHPLSVHEIDPPFDSVIQDESLTDFDLFQAGHRDWPSVATEVALLDKHYARTTVTKPLVVGEIDYEGFAAGHGADLQRAAFWLGMLNGAAGHSYGAVGTWESYGVDEPFQRMKFSFMTWREGMALPGSYQIGLGAKLLQRYPWWKFQPHPEWVSPHGTTLLEPNDQISGFDIDLIAALARKDPPPDDDLPLGEWHNAHGNWRLPYAAGIPREVRFIYLPYFGLKHYPVPTVHGLELGVLYHAFYWEPALGMEVDLGVVESGTATGKVDIEHLDRKLYDARGEYRGELSGPGWNEYGTHQRVEGDTFYPEKPPTVGDWILVLEARK